MAKSYNIRLRHTVDGTPISVPCKMTVIKSEDIIPKPIVKKKDSRGVPIKGNARTSVMKESLAKYMKSKNPDDIDPVAGKGTTVYINEKGELVHEEEIKYWYVDPDTGKESEVDPMDATIGKGMEVEIRKTPSASEKDDFVIEKTFTLTCDPLDTPALYKIVESLAEEGNMGVIDVVMSESFDKFVGMVVPTIDKSQGKFRVEVYVARARIQPDWLDIEGAPAPKPGAPAKAGRKKKTIDVPGAAELFKAFMSPNGVNPLALIVEKKR